MKTMRSWFIPPLVAGLGMLILAAADSADVVAEQLARHRNLGKAFYENPTTKKEAVDELEKALNLAPDSPRERLNYGLALLRAGRTDEGIAEIEKVQEQDPSIPHTWFNLGIEYKRLGEFAKATLQFERMVKLVPTEATSQYNLGVLYKLSGQTEDAIRQFEKAAELEPTLAAPHFQLFNMYRQAKRREEAAAQLEIFRAIKKEQEGAVIAEDMDWSFYSELLDIIEPELDKEPDSRATLRFAAQKLSGELEAGSAGLTVIDAEADGKPDLLAWSADGVALYRNGSSVVRDATLAGVKNVTSVAAGDFDNDGLADLAITTESGPLLLKNNKGGFTKHDAALPDGKFNKAVWLDYDHDADIDLFLLGVKNALLRNQGTAGFMNRTQDFPFAAGTAIDAVVFRVVPDTKALDMVVTYSGRAGVLYQDKLGGKYAAVDLDQAPAGSRGLVAADINNDSWIDIAFTHGGKVTVVLNREGTPEVVSVAADGAPVLVDLENRGRDELVVAGKVYRNQAGGKFGAGALPEGSVEGPVWAAADFDSDGRMDLVAVDAEGAPHLVENRTETEHRWIRVALDGKKAPKLAPIAEVEIKSGVRYQKKIYQGYPLLFGLRADATVDTIRITWPNGLLQNEMKQAANQSHRYEEEERLSGSCPMIWTWDGNEFRYITDVLGVAPLGASAGDGTYFPTDHDEYIQIPSEALVADRGRYEIRITEELSEVAYLDQVELIAVDHPAETDIFINDKFQGPPFPEFRLFGASERHYPVAARDDDGADVLRKLIAKDQRYPDGFPRSRLGVADLHSLELDFADAAAKNNAVMVLGGWVDWADGSTFLGRSQEADGGLVMPYLQVRDANGEWQTVIEDMGIPAGKPKSIVVDLSGKFLSDSREVRIVTNLCVFWDEIFLAENAFDPKVKLTTLVAHDANLRFRGFSEVRIHPQRKQPEKFLYPKPRPASMWNPTPGNYTRYGPVEELLDRIDDRFVIMGSGDEVRLFFDATSMPELPTGWRRDFLLKVDGWAKDRDPNTAYSQTVEPLPFHGMSTYPYPEGEQYPDTPTHRAYTRKYNTRPALRLIRPLARRD